MTPEKIAGATHPELTEHLMTLGHKKGFLVKMPINYLRKLATEGKQFEGGGGVPADGGQQGEGEGGSKESPKPDTPNADSPAPPSPNKPSVSALVDAMAEEIAPKVAKALKPDFMRMVDTLPRDIHIRVKNLDNDIEAPPIDMGVTHKVLPTVCKLALRRKNILLYGPAGSGKGTLSRQLAIFLSKHYDREFKHYQKEFGPASQPYEILGYRDAGNVHETEVKKAWRDGGVILLDEYDASSEVMVCMNSGLDSHGVMTFPDGPIKRHADCIVVAAANTAGLGPTMQYTSRQRLDAATRNRFAFVAIDYDETMEMAAAGTDQRKWVDHVQKLRKAHRSLGSSAPIDVIISPRASIEGADLLRHVDGISYGELEEMFIWQGATDDDKSKVMKAFAKL